MFCQSLMSILSFYLTSYGDFLFQVKEFPTSWSIWHISYAGAKMSFMRKSRPFSEWMGGNGWRAYPACQSFNNTPFLHLGYIPEPVFPAWIWSTSKIWNRQRVESFQAHLSACFSVKTGPDMASACVFVGTASQMIRALSRFHHSLGLPLERLRCDSSPKEECLFRFSRFIEVCRSMSSFVSVIWSC